MGRFNFAKKGHFNFVATAFGLGFFPGELFQYENHYEIIQEYRLKFFDNFCFQTKLRSSGLVKKLG